MIQTSLTKHIIKGSVRLLLVLAAVFPFFQSGIASADTTWTQTTQADFQSGTLSQVDVISSPGNVILARAAATSNFVYAFYGSSATFARYDIANNRWENKAKAPVMPEAGASLAYDGGDCVYAIFGGGSSSFWFYSISNDSWKELNKTCAPVGSGGSLVFSANDKCLYSLAGGGSGVFMVYLLGEDTWKELYKTPDAVSSGGALVCGDKGYLYALQGGGSSTAFWRYSIADDAWKDMAKTPDIIGAGASLAYDGKFIYALRGNGDIAFWIYDIGHDAWTDSTAAPRRVGDGGALTYVNNGLLYAFRGGNTAAFWQFKDPSWTPVSGAAANVTAGGALAPGGLAYYASGNLVSSTRDTGYSANYTAISWTNSLPPGTAMSFQIATNNDNATWIFRGPTGTTTGYYTSSATPIWSGHDGNRYIKYKAFLSTADTAITPVLSSVSISYTRVITSPSAATNLADPVGGTTATLNGTVTNDGGEACQYRFIYGMSSGNYTMNTGWTGSVTTGQTFSAGLTGLIKGTKYFYAAQVKNSVNTGTGIDVELLTRPDPPPSGSFTAGAVSATEIHLEWVKGEGAQRTMVRRSTDTFPVDRDHGGLVYFDTGTSCTDAGLTPGTTYYYRAWSQVSGSDQWSETYQDIIVNTSPGSPVSVGGMVFPVDKMGILMPYLIFGLAGLVIFGVAACTLVSLRHKIGR
jgi:hypothetical protein